MKRLVVVLFAFALLLSGCGVSNDYSDGASEAARKDGYSEGYDVGYDKGYVNGYEEMAEKYYTLQTEASERIDKAISMMDDLAEGYGTLDDIYDYLIKTQTYIMNLK